MPGEDAIEIEGLVKEVLQNKTFRVELPNGHQVIAHVPRHQLTQRDQLAAGQKVILEMTPYDFSQGRIKL